MGIYNLLTCEMKCPYCAFIGPVEVDIRFGFLNLLNYQMGDSVEWTRKVSLNKGGRPDSGNLDGEGWVECPSCDRDYFLVVEIRNDRIAGARVDASKPGYMEQGERLHGKLES